ncbi:MAG TPA: hypothetical protein VHH90_02810 [Polyangia bacterium]|nr:hypothetical protein [Polyangia bacterium]
MPDRIALDRARALLSDIVARDPDGPLARGLDRFGSWRSLAAVVGTDWLPIGGRLSASGLRVARRNLRVLGSPVAEFAAATVGEAVQVGGIVAPLPGNPGGGLWRAEVIEDADGRWLSDEGRDFLLVDRGSRVLVLADRGRLVNAESLHVGDEVAVFGIADEAPDAAGLSGSLRGGRGLALRSGPTRPLLVSVIRRYDRS